ncbi:MAG: flagellar hook-length control protein FliK [Halanaerobiales bacterium]|nr:flagellar hook-length control protein FliK [Halanaerobiales bacterium]
MYAEISAVDVNSADQADFNQKRSSSSRKNKSRFADLLKENGRRVQKEKSLKKKSRAEHMNKTSAEKNTGRSKKELKDLKERLNKELELDDPQRASELALFMLENDLNLEELLNFFPGAGISAESSELSAENKTELTELFNTELTAENGSSNLEAGARPLKSGADSAELLDAEVLNINSELRDLIKNSEKLELNSRKEIFNSAWQKKNGLELQNLESSLREILVQLSDQNYSKLEKVLAEENKEQKLISKLLQNIRNSVQQAEVGPAEIIKEFSDGDILAQLRKILAENGEKDLTQVGTAEDNIRTKADRASALADRLFNTAQSSSQKTAGELNTAASVLFQTEKEQAEVDIFNGQSYLEYFNLNSESRAAFELTQGNGIDHIRPGLSVEEQIMETFKAEYSAENRELAVELKPASLGKIDISLSYEGDRLIGKMLVESELIRSSLEKSLNTLKTELVKEGINIEQFKIQTAENRPTQPEQQDQFAFNQEQSRSGDADSGQNQNYQQKNTFRQHYLNQNNSINSYEELDSSIKSSKLNYGWKQNALNLLA